MEKKATSLMFIAAALAALMVATVMVVAVPTQAQAAPYPDVKKSTVGDYAYKSISFVKAKGGYQGVIAKTKYVKQKNGLYKKVQAKFQPGKAMKRSEFLTVLGNLYGTKNVPVTYTDVKKANKVVTAKFVCSKLVKLGKRLGKDITWKVKDNVKLNRASAANYIYVFANYDSHFMPK
ncbi:MAG: hypothetical protein Q4F56_00860 [Candidatus Saccharibacteria bacterium]|nr:hypothetical protein [Candidatus Saccharibacteria bacterium]